MPLVLYLWSMDPLRALVVDDEFHARDNLSLLIGEFCPELKVVGQAGSIKEAKTAIHELEPEVVFLDIRMPSGAEGFDLIDSIDNPRFQVVFVTAFKDYAVRAFQANAVHYILKPIDIEDLRNAVEKLVQYQENFNADEGAFLTYQKAVKEVPHLAGQKQLTKLTLHHQHGFKICEIHSIIRMESVRNYTMIHFEDGQEYFDAKTLKVFEDLLRESAFCRVHKSHLLNLNHLEEYNSKEGHFAVMSNGDEIPISRGKLGEFLTEVRNKI